MAYTMLKNAGPNRSFDKNSLEDAALRFLRERCEGLRFDDNKAAEEARTHTLLGKSNGKFPIPYNMQMDVDRLCLENALARFLRSGRKEDAFDVYFCYLEMFIGSYDKSRRMIELLSEFESNGSRLLMKHRDHYSHSVYVFILGLAIFQTNACYRGIYRTYYGLIDSSESAAAQHFLEHWGLASLFHDIGYPFELPFEQVCSYFEVGGRSREDCPFVAYNAIESFCGIDGDLAAQLARLYGTGEEPFVSTNTLFAYVLEQKLAETYGFSSGEMLGALLRKPTHPESFGHYMDHAYFSATLLFNKLFGDLKLEITKPRIDALTAILLHNSLYKFSIARYKDAEHNIPLRAKLHPIAYLLMLCDELQCWDRIAYGRNSRRELHPFGCRFDFSGGVVDACYLFDEEQQAGMSAFEEDYAAWSQHGKKEVKPKLKAFSDLYAPEGGVCAFQKDIARIVDSEDVPIRIRYETARAAHQKNPAYLSESSYIHLYSFALVLNGVWGSVDEWRAQKAAGQEERYVSNAENQARFWREFDRLSLEYKLSNINQAKSFAKYMDAINCIFTDKDVDLDMVRRFTPEELLKIGPMEHRRWLQEHLDMGWSYGEFGGRDPRRELVRQHMDMIPGLDPAVCEISAAQAEENYLRIGKAEQEKDTEPMECMLAMLRVFDGLRIYRLR